MSWYGGVALLWLAFGVLNYGGTLAYFQRTSEGRAASHYDGDRSFALFMACFGPVGSVLMVLMGGFSEGLQYGRE